MQGTLHWIDSETQALLNSLVESLPTAQLLLLVTYRAGVSARLGQQDVLLRRSQAGPLPPASTAEILQALLGDDPGLGAALSVVD